MRVESLYVYPVKGLSGQPLEGVALRRGHGFPHDREYAFALADGEYYPGMPVGLAKTNFLMLMRDERLAEARTRYDPETAVLVAEHPAGGLSADLSTESGRSEAAQYFGRLAGVPEGQTPVVAHDHGRRFTDVARRGDEPMQWASLVNLATVRDLERRSGRAVDPLRFRANIYADLGEPFRERDLVGHSFALGGVRVEGVRETTRCPATEVDPATGARDTPVLDLLEDHFGQAVMGIYVRVLTDGRVAVGDPVTPD